MAYGFRVFFLVSFYMMRYKLNGRSLWNFKLHFDRGSAVFVMLISISTLHLIVALFSESDPLTIKKNVTHSIIRDHFPPTYYI